MLMRCSTLAKRRIAYFAIAAAIASVLTWPILQAGRFLGLSIFAAMSTMLWLIAVFEVSSATRGSLLIAAAMAAVFGVVAPLLAALALREGGATFPVWWLGLSGLLWVATATVAISRWRELGSKDE